MAVVAATAARGGVQWFLSSTTQPEIASFPLVNFGHCGRVGILRVLRGFKCMNIG